MRFLRDIAVGDETDVKYLSNNFKQYLLHGDVLQLNNVIGYLDICYNSLSLCCIY